MRTPNKIFCWILAINGLAALIFAVVFLPEYIKYSRLVKNARICYEHSRRNPAWKHDSYEFITRGILADMTEDEVDERMKGATERIAHLRQVQPPWDGFMNIYVFHHGQLYKNPFTGRQDILFHEEFRVYFNQDGCAKRMSRSLFCRDGKYHEDESIDLEKHMIMTDDN